MGYFVPGQRFTPMGVEQDGWIQIIDSDGNRLWIQEGGPYGPVGEVEIPTPTEVPGPVACPPGSEVIPPEIGRYQHGGPTELFHANAARFSPFERAFLGGREEIFFGHGRIVKIDLPSETITVESLSGTLIFRFSSQTLFGLFDTNIWGYIYTDKCKFQEGDMARVYVEAPVDGAFLAGIWK